MSVKQSANSPSASPSETADEGGGQRSDRLKMTIPTGRIQEKVLALLERVGVKLSANGRSYRPACSQPDIEIKLLKAQNIPSLVALGRHECGFSGFDWITEQEADVVELMDLEYDPVRIVAAVPEQLAENDRYLDLGRPIIVASEYRKLTAEFLKGKKLDAIFVQTFGATEALPPEDADMIVDNTSTGTTLRANRLIEIETLMKSTTRFICNRQVLENPVKRRRLEELTMLMKSTIRAKEKVLLEMNVSREDFERLVVSLPCMRAPTISELYNGDGYAIKIAVPVPEVPALIPRLVALGARDILEYKLEKIVS